MTLELLQARFAVSDHPGLDTLDPRWSELSGLAGEGRFAEAAAMSAALLGENVHDVRVIGYYCFGGFLDGGPAALATLCAALSSVLNDNWEAVGPSAGKVKLTQQSLAWLWKQIGKQLQHVEAQAGDEWQAWQETPAEAIDDALTRMFELQQALGPRLDKGAPAVLEPLGKVEAWLRAFQSALSRAPVGGEGAADAADEDGDTRDDDATTTAATTTAATASAGANGVASVKTAAAMTTSAATVDGGSYHLAQLLRKIEAFARLVERGRMTPALVVAEDIHATLAQFDPLLFFPKLFARFIQLTAVHAGELAKVPVEREAASWKALRSLYQVDLDLFLALD